MTPSVNDNKGFTLLELLLAFFIFSLIVGTIYASYSGSFTTINMTESRMDTYRKAAIALARISEDLQAAYISLQPADSFGVESDSTRFVGKDGEIDWREADTLSFFSKIGALFEDADDAAVGQLISYEIIQGEKTGELVLLRTEHGQFLDQSEAAVGLPLCDGLQAVKFTYVDDEGEEQDSWDTESEENADILPRVVSIALLFPNHENPDEPQLFKTGVGLPVQSLPVLLDGGSNDNNLSAVRRKGIREISRAYHKKHGNMREAI